MSGSKGIEQIMDEVRRRSQERPGANLSIWSLTGPGGGQKPVIMSVAGRDMAMLAGTRRQVERIVRTTPGAVDVENSLETRSRKCASASTGRRPPTWG